MLIYRLQSSCSYFCAHWLGIRWQQIVGFIRSVLHSPNFFFFHFSLFSLLRFDRLPFHGSSDQFCASFCPIYFPFNFFINFRAESVGPGTRRNFLIWLSSQLVKFVMGIFPIAATCRRPPWTDRQLRSENFHPQNRQTSRDFWWTQNRQDGAAQ